MSKKYFLLSFCLACALLFPSCFKSGNKNDDKKDVVDVFIVESIKADVKWDVLYPATVGGVKVKSKVSGTLNEITYKEGEYIEKGASMFVVDKQANRAVYDRASVNFDKVKQEYDKSKTKLNKAKAQYEKKSMKKKDYDAAAAEHSAIESAYKKAQEEMKDAEIQLKNTRIRAPISGVAGIPLYPAGTEISPVEGTDTLTYISTLNSLSVTLLLREEVVNNFLSGFLQGKAKTDTKLKIQAVPVEALFSDGAVYPDAGGIVLFGGKSEGKKGWLPVEAEFPNPGKKKLMIPGQEINIKIKDAAYKDAVVILKSCIFKTGNGSFVFVVQNDNCVAAVPVNYENAGEFVFVTSGLNGGETVVSYASGSIEAGKKVNPKKREFSLPDSYRAEIVPFKEEQPEKEEAAAKRPVKKQQTSGTKQKAAGTKTAAAKPKKAGTKTKTAVSKKTSSSSKTTAPSAAKKPVKK